MVYWINIFRYQYSKRPYSSSVLHVSKQSADEYIERVGAKNHVATVPVEIPDKEGKNNE